MMPLRPPGPPNTVAALDAGEGPVPRDGPWGCPTGSAAGTREMLGSGGTRPDLADTILGG